MNETQQTSEEARAGVALMGQIMSANAAATEHTTNLLLAAKDEDILRLATTIKTIAEILDQATVIDRLTERRLERIAGQIDAAYQYVRDGLERTE